MHPAQEGIFKRCRGLAALLLALCGTFVAASRHGGAAPDAAVSSTGTIGRFDNLQDLVERARVDARSKRVLNHENADATIADDILIEAFDVGKNADALFLPVMIDGQEWWFLVDTGCGETIVDLEVAIHVGLIDRRELKLHNRWHAARRPLDANIGKSRIPVACQAVCFDLSELRGCRYAFPLCGILVVRPL